MAKKSKIAKNKQREAVVARYAEYRNELKKASVNVNLSAEERAEAMAKLHALPRDASPVRLRSRDVVDGRPRSVYRDFGLSRIRLRDMVHAGQLPGVRKSSW